MSPNILSENSEIFNIITVKGNIPIDQWIKEFYNLIIFFYYFHIWI